MAIKDDVKAIKEQIGAEEQFLENIIKGERIFKKYKIPIIVAFTTLILLSISYLAYDFLKEQNLKNTNKSYEALLINPDDKKALEILKNNKTLHEVFIFMNANKSKDLQSLKEIANILNDPVLKSIANYEIGEKTEMLKEIQSLIKGYELLKQNKIEQANLKFSEISLSSPLQNIAKKLKHFKGAEK